MTTGLRVALTTALVLVLAGGAYVTADAYDVVPGMVTLAPPVPDPSPFPTAPGAGDPADVEQAMTELDAQVPLPSADAVQALVDDLAGDARLGSSADVGVLVVDELTGEVLGEHQADDARTPASTAKLLTAVAALTTLDPATTLRTSVVVSGDRTVALVGGGDMMLAAGDGDPDATVGHAGLADLARDTAAALALQGVTSVHLEVDDTLFTGPTVSPSWAATDLTGGYVAPVTALAVNIAKTTEGEYVPRHADPSMAAAAVFVERLADAGVTVEGSPVRRTTAADGIELAGVDSAPLVDVVHHFLDSSDNTITEVVSRLVAIDAGLPASFDGGTQAVLREIGNLGVDVSAARLADASGLADGSQLTPRILVDVVRLTVDGEHPELRDIATGMPIGGLTGTLADRYTTSDARGLVRAKTGSLAGVTSLAGTVLDEQRRQMVFALMADSTPAGGQWAPRQALDGFVTSLAACGCR